MRIERLLRLVRVMTHEEVPPHGVVLARQRMERRNDRVKSIRQAVDARRLRGGADHRPRIAAGFKQQHFVTGLGQAGRHGSTAGAGADDDVVGVGGRVVGRLSSGHVVGYV